MSAKGPTSVVLDSLSGFVTPKTLDPPTLRPSPRAAFCVIRVRAPSATQKSTVLLAPHPFSPGLEAQ